MNANRYWTIRPELVKETEVHYRDKIVSRLTGLTTLEKVKVVTFDGVAPEIRPGDVKVFLRFVDKISNAFRGTGVEVGAGTGFFSALLSSLPRVEKIYAVEISKPIVDDLMPEVVSEFSQGNDDKVVPCVGDFSQMNLPDESADFIFDFFSLHHSDDLITTFKEMGRVLKPGGKIVCLDKARANILTDADLGALLDIEYPEKVKVFMGIDPKLKWTRRMNGEKEFRLRDWERFGKSAGLKLDFFSHVAMTKSSHPIFKIVKELLSHMPASLQLLFTKVTGLSGRKHANNLETKNLVFSPALNRFPKEISVFIFKK